MGPVLASHSGANFEDVQFGRPLMIQARQRRVADRASQMGLTFLDRRSIVGGGHRVLAEASIVQLFDVHWAMLAKPVGRERRQPGTV